MRPASAWRGALAAALLASLAGCAASRGQPPRDAAAVPAVAANADTEALLAEAIAAAGGADALARVRALHWTGEATVFAGDRRIELGVDTRVEPFLRAKSDTWLRDQGRASLRTLEVTPDGGWMVRDGQRTAMPEAMLAHERLQYATYGLMLLAPLRDPGVVVRRGADIDSLRTLHVQDARAAPSDLAFDAGGRLVRLDDRVPSPEGRGIVDQRFDFEGTIEANGIRWPRVVRITQGGKPWFELRIATLAVER
jgi:hypothetical protein